MKIYLGSNVFGCYTQEREFPSTVICDPLKEKLALPANVDFELQVIIATKSRFLKQVFIPMGLNTKLWSCGGMGEGHRFAAA